MPGILCADSRQLLRVLIVTMLLLLLLMFSHRCSPWITKQRTKKRLDGKKTNKYPLVHHTCTAVSCTYARERHYCCRLTRDNHCNMPSCTTLQYVHCGADSCLVLCVLTHTRYSDFRALWKGLSRRYPQVEAFDFPPKSSVFRARGVFSSVGRVEEERQRKFTAVLKIMVSLLTV